jgi:hypothetical protein
MHSFHLLCGEMMIILQDVTMLLGLPIRGDPVIGPAAITLFFYVLVFHELVFHVQLSITNLFVHFLLRWVVCESYLD